MTLVWFPLGCGRSAVPVLLGMMFTGIQEELNGKMVDLDEQVTDE